MQKTEIKLMKESQIESEKRSDDYLKNIKDLADTAQENYKESERENEVLTSQLNKLKDLNEKKNNTILLLNEDLEKVKKEELEKRDKLSDEINCLKKELKTCMNELQILKTEKDYVLI